MSVDTIQVNKVLADTWGGYEVAQIIDVNHIIAIVFIVAVRVGVEMLLNKIKRRNKKKKNK